MRGRGRAGEATLPQKLILIPKKINEGEGLAKLIAPHGHDSPASPPQPTAHSPEPTHPSSSERDHPLCLAPWSLPPSTWPSYDPVRIDRS
jgi:hypothetical protein